MEAARANLLDIATPFGGESTGGAGASGLWPRALLRMGVCTYEVSASAGMTAGDAGVGGAVHSPAA